MDHWSLLGRQNPVKLHWDYMLFDYDNFRDVTVHSGDNAVLAGEEPTYGFGANVVRLYWSVWL